MRDKFDTGTREADDLRREYDPTNVHTHLQIATAQAEQNSESIAESFINGESCN